MNDTIAHNPSTRPSAAKSARENIRDTRELLERLVSLVVLKQPNDVSVESFADLAKAMATNLEAAEEDLDGEGVQEEQPQSPEGKQSANFLLLMANLYEARTHLDRLMGIVTISSEEGKITEEDFQLVRQQASFLAGELTSAENEIEPYAKMQPDPRCASSGRSDGATARVSSSKDDPSGELEVEMGVDDDGKPMPLREAVDHQLENIGGMIQSIRDGVDQAIIAHTFLVGAGSAEAEGWDVSRRENDFPGAVAFVECSLKCLEGYLDRIRLGAVERYRKQHEKREVFRHIAREYARDQDISAAAEE